VSGVKYQVSHDTRNLTPDTLYGPMAQRLAQATHNQLVTAYNFV